MHKNYFFVLLSVFANQLLFSQTYSFKGQVAPNDKKEFLKLTEKLFYADNQLTYNISTSDSQVKFADMSDQIQYNDAYLQQLKAAWSKDSLNAITLNNYANYYVSKGNKSLARIYFKKALDHLSLKTFAKKDSASYYSFRGLLKSNLETEGAINDLEKSLRINPNDSIAINFYPMFLLMNNRFPEAKKICTNALEKKSTYPELPFTILCTALIFEKSQTFLNASESEKAENLKKNYDELLDFKTMYYYADLNKNSPQVQNAKKTVEIIGLFMKMGLFEMNEDSEYILRFNAYEIKKINELQKEFKELLAQGKINPFTGNKSLCVLNYMLNNRDKAIDYAKKAIAVFPNSKRNIQFNSDESYAFLLNLVQKDVPNYKKILEEKIQKSSESEKFANDYLAMAYTYLYENDLVHTEEWCNKAREIDTDNFKALCLTAHLKFMNDQFSLADFYIQLASKQVNSDNDNYDIGMQCAAYMIINGNAADAKSAFDNIENCRKISEPKECKICNGLIEKYIQVNP